MLIVIHSGNCFLLSKNGEGQDTLNSNFTICFVWLWDMESYSKETTKVVAVPNQWAQENMWVWEDVVNKLVSK
jgi:hypothetical protein